MRESTVVAHIDQLPPGKMLYVEVDGMPIGLANVEGEIFAFSDSCRHLGGPLSSGFLRDGVVTCPWHGWAYSVRTGKAIVPPVGLRIPTFAVSIEDDQIAVEIDWPDN